MSYSSQKIWTLLSVFENKIKPLKEKKSPHEWLYVPWIFWFWKKKHWRFQIEILKSIRGVIVHSLKTLELIIEASSEIFTIDMTESFTEILALLGQKSQALTKKHWQTFFLSMNVWFQKISIHFHKGS